MYIINGENDTDFIVWPLQNEYFIFLFKQSLVLEVNKKRVMSK